MTKIPLAPLLCDFSAEVLSLSLAFAYCLSMLPSTSMRPTLGWSQGSKDEEPLSLGWGSVSPPRLPTPILDSMSTPQGSVEWGEGRGTWALQRLSEHTQVGFLGPLGRAPCLRLPALPILWKPVSEALGAELGVGRAVRTLSQQG